MSRAPTQQAGQLTGDMLESAAIPTSGDPETLATGLDRPGPTTAQPSVQGVNPGLEAAGHVGAMPEPMATDTQALPGGGQALPVPGSPAADVAGVPQGAGAPPSSGMGTPPAGPEVAGTTPAHVSNPGVQSPMASPSAERASVAPPTGDGTVAGPVPGADGQPVPMMPDGLVAAHSAVTGQFPQPQAPLGEVASLPDQTAPLTDASPVSPSPSTTHSGAQGAVIQPDTTSAAPQGPTPQAPGMPQSPESSDVPPLSGLASPPPAEAPIATPPPVVGGRHDVSPAVSSAGVSSSVPPDVAVPLDAADSTAGTVPNRETAQSTSDTPGLDVDRPASGTSGAAMGVGSPPPTTGMPGVPDAAATAGQTPLAEQAPLPHDDGVSVPPALGQDPAPANPAVGAPPSADLPATPTASGGESARSMAGVETSAPSENAGPQSAVAQSQGEPSASTAAIPGFTPHVPVGSTLTPPTTPMAGETVAADPPPLETLPEVAPQQAGALPKSPVMPGDGPQTAAAMPGEVPQPSPAMPGSGPMAMSELPMAELPGESGALSTVPGDPHGPSHGQQGLAGPVPSGPLTGREAQPTPSRAASIEGGMPGEGPVEADQGPFGVPADGAAPSPVPTTGQGSEAAPVVVGPMSAGAPDVVSAGVPHQAPVPGSPVVQSPHGTAMAPETPTSAVTPPEGRPIRSESGDAPVVAPDLQPGAAETSALPQDIPLSSRVDPSRAPMPQSALPGDTPAVLGSGPLADGPVPPAAPDVATPPQSFQGQTQPPTAVEGSAQPAGLAEAPVTGPAGSSTPGPDSHAAVGADTERPAVAPGTVPQGSGLPDDGTALAGASAQGVAPHVDQAAHRDPGATVIDEGMAPTNAPPTPDPSVAMSAGENGRESATAEVAATHPTEHASGHLADHLAAAPSSAGAPPVQPLPGPVGAGTGSAVGQPSSTQAAPELGEPPLAGGDVGQVAGVVAPQPGEAAVTAPVGTQSPTTEGPEVSEGVSPAEPPDAFTAALNATAAPRPEGYVPPAERSAKDMMSFADLFAMKAPSARTSASDAMTAEEAMSVMPNLADILARPKAAEPQAATPAADTDPETDVDLTTAAGQRSVTAAGSAGSIRSARTPGDGSAPELGSGMAGAPEPDWSLAKAPEDDQEGASRDQQSPGGQGQAQSSDGVSPDDRPDEPMPTAATPAAVGPQRPTPTETPSPGIDDGTVVSSEDGAPSPDGSTGLESELPPRGNEDATPGPVADAAGGPTPLPRTAEPPAPAAPSLPEGMVLADDGLPMPVFPAPQGMAGMPATGDASPMAAPAPFSPQPDADIGGSSVGTSGDGPASALPDGIPLPDLDPGLAPQDGVVGHPPQTAVPGMQPAASGVPAASAGDPLGGPEMAVPPPMPGPVPATPMADAAGVATPMSPPATGQPDLPSLAGIDPNLMPTAAGPSPNPATATPAAGPGDAPTTGPAPSTTTPTAYVTPYGEEQVVSFKPMAGGQPRARRQHVRSVSQEAMQMIANIEQAQQQWAATPPKPGESLFDDLGPLPPRPAVSWKERKAQQAAARAQAAAGMAAPGAAAAAMGATGQVQPAGQPPMMDGQASPSPDADALPPPPSLPGQPPVGEPVHQAAGMPTPGMSQPDGPRVIHRTVTVAAPERAVGRKWSGQVHLLPKPPAPTRADDRPVAGPLPGTEANESAVAGQPSVSADAEATLGPEGRVVDGPDAAQPGASPVAGAAPAGLDAEAALDDDRPVDRDTATAEPGADLAPTVEAVDDQAANQAASGEAATLPQTAAPPSDVDGSQGVPSTAMASGNNSPDAPNPVPSEPTPSVDKPKARSSFLGSSLTQALRAGQAATNPDAATDAVAESAAAGFALKMPGLTGPTPEPKARPQQPETADPNDPMAKLKSKLGGGSGLGSMMNTSSLMGGFVAGSSPKPSGGSFFNMVSQPSAASAGDPPPDDAETSATAMPGQSADQEGAVEADGVAGQAPAVAGSAGKPTIAVASPTGEATDEVAVPQDRTADFVDEATSEEAPGDGYTDTAGTPAAGRTMGRGIRQGGITQGQADGDGMATDPDASGTEELEAETLGTGSAAEPQVAEDGELSEIPTDEAMASDADGDVPAATPGRPTRGQPAQPGVAGIQTADAGDVVPVDGEDAVVGSELAVEAADGEALVADGAEAVEGDEATAAPVRYRQPTLLRQSERMAAAVARIPVTRSETPERPAEAEPEARRSGLSGGMVAPAMADDMDLPPGIPIPGAAMDVPGLIPDLHAPIRSLLSAQADESATTDAMMRMAEMMDVAEELIEGMVPTEADPGNLTTTGTIVAGEVGATVTPQAQMGDRQRFQKAQVAAILSGTALPTGFVASRSGAVSQTPSVPPPVAAAPRQLMPTIGRQPSPVAGERPPERPRTPVTREMLAAMPPTLRPALAAVTLADLGAYGRWDQSRLTDARPLDQRPLPPNVAALPEEATMSYVQLGAGRMPELPEEAVDGRIVMPQPPQQAPKPLVDRAAELAALVKAAAESAVVTSGDEIPAHVSRMRSVMGKVENNLSRLDEDLSTVIPRLAKRPKADEEDDTFWDWLFGADEEMSDSERVAKREKAWEKASELRENLQTLNRAVKENRSQLFARETLAQATQALCVPLTLPGQPPIQAELLVHPDGEDKKKGGSGKHPTRIQLAIQTHHLGSVGVSVEAMGERLSVGLQVTTPQIKALFEKLLGELTAQLGNTGYQLDPIGVQVAAHEMMTSLLLPQKRTRWGTEAIDSVR